MDDRGFTVERVVADALATWDGMRRRSGRRAGDERFREWFFEVVPAARLGDDRDTHAVLSFEVAVELFDRGRVHDAFAVLRWLGRHFAAAPDVGTRVRAVMALTDTCAERATDREARDLAIGVLRDVVGSVHAPVDVPVQDALCRALSTAARLSGEGVVLDRATTRRLVSLWRGLADRCRGSADPRLRDWRAHALGNEALLWLQVGREDRARRAFAAITAEFGADPPAPGSGMPGSDVPGSDVHRWVTRARYAPTVLDRFDVGEAVLRLDYLRRQRYWDRRLRFRGLGLAHWLLAGAPRNRLRLLARRARERHRASVGQVRAWLCAGEPFVLLLRNFDLTERSGVADRSRLGAEDEPDHVRVITMTAGAAALAELAAGVPLVLVASTTAGELEVVPDPGGFTAPVRLYLPDETWFDTVSTLAGVAGQVVVWAAGLSAGLARELDALTALRRTDDTLVVLEHPVAPSPVLPGTPGEPLTADHPALAPFPHVVPAEELRGRRVPECPPLVRVLDRLDAVRQEPVERRLARLTGRQTG
ncbi:hypothetical protein ACIGNX_15290 [Actinosynnema sp. NPDC053489]|uniref:hypothetical protein n=1 Tax=Actinosynnema sp. NPDC053489 TaxID=3363916 RepID=UPI0037C997B8